MLHWWSFFACVFPTKKNLQYMFPPPFPGPAKPPNILGIPCIVGGRPPCRFSHHHVLISLPKALESTYLAISLNISPTHLDFPKKIRRFPVTKLPFGFGLRSCEVAIIWRCWLRTKSNRTTNPLHWWRVFEAVKSPLGSKQRWNVRIWSLQKVIPSLVTK